MLSAQFQVKGAQGEMQLVLYEHHGKHGGPAFGTLLGQALRIRGWSVKCYHLAVPNNATACWCGHEPRSGLCTHVQRECRKAGERRGWTPDEWAKWHHQHQLQQAQTAREEFDEILAPMAQAHDVLPW